MSFLDPKPLTAGSAAAQASDPATPLGAALNSAYGQGLFIVSGNDLAGAVSSIVAAGGGVLYVPEGATVTTSTVTVLPDEVTGVRVDGEIVCTADVSVFTRDGEALDSSTNITAPILAGQRTVSAATTNLAIDDWVFVVSADTLPGSGDKLGYLRKVKAVDATTVTFDSPIPRDMPDSTRRLRKIRMANPITVYGSGTIRYSDPAAAFSAMLKFTFCQDVQVRDLTLRDGGHNAVRLSHVAGFKVDCRIDNFIDNIAQGHIGYGVNAEGGTRDGRVLGGISRCRHAFTTNVGPNHPAFGFYGEPENIDVYPTTRACTDKALDTHRAGWGIRMRINDKGSGGGIQIRSDATHAEGVMDGNYIGQALAIGPGIVFPPTIGPLKVLNHQGPGVTVMSDVRFTSFPDFQKVTGELFAFSNGAKITTTPDVRVCKAASDTVVNNSTAHVAATGLTFMVEANATYKVEGTVIYGASQAGDLSLSWAAPAGAAMDWTVNALSTGSTSTGGSIVRAHKLIGESAPLGGVAVGTKIIATPGGLLTVGATGGAVTLKFAQATADATDATIYTGSHLIVSRVS